MIEPTDEMTEAARAAYRTSQAPDAAGQMRDVVAAVLAIVELDYRVEPRPPWDRCTCPPPYGSSTAPDPACPVHHRRARRQGAP